VADVTYGYAFSSTGFNQQRTGMPLIRIRDISRSDTEAYFDGRYDPAYIVRKGDYLVGMDGDFNVRKWRGPDGLLNQRVARMNNWRCGIDADFMVVPLQMILNQLHAWTPLSTVKHLSARQMSQIFLPLPPLSEQHRIAAKMTELLTLCNELEGAQIDREDRRNRLVLASLARLTQAPEEDGATFRKGMDFYVRHLSRLTTRPGHVSALRRTVLDLAVRGKLTEQRPEDEPASALLERVARRMSEVVTERRLMHHGSLPPVDADEIAFALPEGWSGTRLGLISVCLDNMRKPVNITERKRRIIGKEQHEVYPYFGATQQQGWIDDYIFDEELVLLGEDGVPFLDPSRKKAYVISGKTWVNNHAHVLRCLLVSTKFIAHALNAFDYTGRVTGSTRWKLNQSKALDIPIALPPINEQQRIVERVEECVALCDALELARKEREGRREALLEATIYATLHK
jgi:type I restriction enzyme S subunit